MIALLQVGMAHDTVASSVAVAAAVAHCGDTIGQLNLV
jgi:hypothetical protein